MNHSFIQFAGQLFPLLIVVVSVLLLSYWLFCSCHLMAGGSGELTEEELAPFLWKKRARSLVARLARLTH